MLRRSGSQGSGVSAQMLPHKNAQGFFFNPVMAQTGICCLDESAVLMRTAGSSAKAFCAADADPAEPEPPVPLETAATTAEPTEPEAATSWTSPLDLTPLPARVRPDLALLRPWLPFHGSTRQQHLRLQAQTATDVIKFRCSEEPRIPHRLRLGILESLQGSALSNHLKTPNDQLTK